jgi:hypothetical protein
MYFRGGRQATNSLNDGTHYAGRQATNSLSDGTHYAGRQATNSLSDGTHYAGSKEFETGRKEFLFYKVQSHYKSDG